MMHETRILLKKLEVTLDTTLAQLRKDRQGACQKNDSYKVTFLDGQIRSLQKVSKWVSNELDERR